MDSNVAHTPSSCIFQPNSKRSQALRQSQFLSLRSRTQKGRPCRGRNFLGHRCRRQVAVNCTGDKSVGHESSFGKELAEWIASNGGKVESVQVVKETSGTWGLRAGEDVTKGTVLVELPSGCQLMYDQCTDTRLLSLIDQVPETLWAGKLALKVLYERVRGENSMFRPYLKSLPVGVPGIPIFYNGPIIQDLQYPPLIEQVKMRCQWLVNFATKNLQAIGGSEQDPFNGVTVDVNGLGWGLAVVTSRAFRTRGPDKPAAMLPLIDMCNHSFEPNCEIVGESSGVALIAKTDLEAEEPLLLNYGKLPNDYLLLDYGFVVRSNPYDTVQLRFDVGMVEVGRTIGGLSRANIGKGMREDGSLELYPWQLEALSSLNLIGRSADLQLHIGGASIVDPRLLAAVRILFISDPSQIQGRDPKSLGSWDDYIDAENEVKTLRTLAGLLASVTTRFGTTLEEDQELLSEGKIEDPNLPLVLAFRVEKKLIVFQAINYIGNKLKVLQETFAQSQEGSNNKDKGFG